MVVLSVLKVSLQSQCGVEGTYSQAAALANPPLWVLQRAMLTTN